MFCGYIYWIFLFILGMLTMTCDLSQDGEVWLKEQRTVCFLSENVAREFSCVLNLRSNSAFKETMAYQGLCKKSCTKKLLFCIQNTSRRYTERGEQEGIRYMDGI